MRLPFKEKEPEPTAWWPADTESGKKKKTAKDVPRSTRKPASNHQTKPEPTAWWPADTDSGKKKKTAKDVPRSTRKPASNRQTEPEPTAWWPAGTDSGKKKKTAKDVPRSTGKPASNRKTATRSSQNQKVRPEKQQKQPAQSRTRTFIAKGLRKSKQKDQSFVDHMEESVCSWCKSVENSSVFYYSAYHINAIIDVA